MSDECLTCGACCFSHAPDAVRLSGEDHERLGALADTLAVWVGNRCYLRFEGGRCSSLRADARTGSFTCEHYEVRPHTCRALEPGSPACEAERWHKAHRAQGLLASLRASEAPRTEAAPSPSDRSGAGGRS